MQADTGNHLLRRLNISQGLVTTIAGDLSNNYGYADGQGRAASFYDPYDVAMDAAGTFVVVVSGVVQRKGRDELTG